MKYVILLCMLSGLLNFSSCAKDGEGMAEPAVDTNRYLSITIGDQRLRARLYDNSTASDFITRLPLTVDLSDYAGAEKIFTPSPELTIKGVSVGMSPRRGDIALYIPWGNLAFYYRDGTFSNSLIPIGRVEGDISALAIPGEINDVKFELESEESDEGQEDGDLPGDNNEGNMNNQVEIIIGSTHFGITLVDNAATAALKKLLPMTVNMIEANGNEKYYNLSGNLPTDVSRPGSIHAGDLMLWGTNCVVLFYETFSSSYSYTRLGCVDDVSKLKEMLGKGNVTVIFK